MHNLSKISVLLITFSLGACQLLPGQSPSTSSCPAPESTTPECPVCKTPRCPEPRIVEKIVTREIEVPAKPTSGGALNLPIIGAVEWVNIEPGDLRLEARIDTGAETSSLHAENIRLIEKDGKRYVRFEIFDNDRENKIPLELRLKRSVLIKQPKGQSERRYVVRVRATLGNTRALIDVTLADRSNLRYPMLVGRNLLTDTAIVDVGRHHTLSP